MDIGNEESCPFATIPSEVITLIVSNNLITEQVCSWFPRIRAVVSQRQVRAYGAKNARLMTIFSSIITTRDIETMLMVFNVQTLKLLVATYPEEEYDRYVLAITGVSMYKIPKRYNYDKKLNLVEFACKSPNVMILDLLYNYEKGADYGYSREYIKECATNSDYFILNCWLYAINTI
jgi:hypothetical protein